MKAIVYLGIDLHKESITFCMMNRKGAVKFMVMATKWRRIASIHKWGRERELEVQALRFGEAGLAFMPGEVYVEFAIRIKQESPLYPHTYAVELSGDDISYIPTRETFPQGGYTVTACRFEPGIGEALADEALAALADAAKQ